MLANARDSVELQFVGLDVVKEGEVNDWGIFQLWCAVVSRIWFWYVSQLPYKK